MKITGTFLDEISHDIPHQNWGEAEWDLDFAAMRATGIDIVILIRSGYQNWLTFPSTVLSEHEACFLPSLDLISLFLRLSAKHGMKLFVGTYDSGKYWQSGEFSKEVDINQKVIEEIWVKYGDHPAFGGWYLSQEVSRRTAGIIELYAKMGTLCKQLSGDLPVMISPWMDGVKSSSAYTPHILDQQGISAEQHRREWSETLEAVKESVDIVAFQDGHVGWQELPQFLEVNRSIATEHEFQCWSNAETFDRDMPIKFLPLKWEKLLYKLQAAEKAGAEKVITFEFSHFMSPNSSYPQAKHLHARYCEHFGIEVQS